MSDLTNSKFIQIASNENGLDALDDEGRVWFFDPRERIWRMLSGARDPRENEEWNVPGRKR